MIAPDTSVVVAAASPWHDLHSVALSALRDGGARLPAHVAVETYAVLTRMPPPHRVAPRLVRDYLARRFAGPVLTLPADDHVALLDAAAEGGIAGGAVYDALVGATSRAAGATLVTLDRRAAATYQAVGAPYQTLP